MFAGALCGATPVKADLTSQIQATGVNATAYAAKLQGGEIALVILNKDVERDLELTLDFGPSRSGAVETAMLHAPALDSREARTSPASRSAARSSRAGAQSRCRMPRDWAAAKRLSGYEKKS
jgi:hypothetical protein